MEYEIKPLNEDGIRRLKEKVGDEIRRFAPPIPGASDEKLILRVSDRDKNFLGGLIFTLDIWASLELVNLWIDDRYRGRGLGSALICEAERIARERGCDLSIVSTWSYQARPLYEKHGYKLCSTVTDWPEGYDSFFLTKRLDVPENGYAASKHTPATEYTVEPGNNVDEETIHKKLYEYNCSRVPRLHPHVSVAEKLVDADGRTIAGCAADIDSIDIAVLEAIWVEESSRLRGAGTYLLEQVERRVKDAGGIFVVAYVCDKSAGFFEKNGYSRCGEIPGHPKGRSTVTLKKIL